MKLPGGFHCVCIDQLNANSARVNRNEKFAPQQNWGRWKIFCMLMNGGFGINGRDGKFLEISLQFFNIQNYGK